MNTIKKKPTDEQLKFFNKGWGRAVACAMHWFEKHCFVNFNHDLFIEYMNKNRERQFTV